ncbi:MAG TPA: hypothetical protein VK966_04690, partial [Longimicrobiales bacterium]|nr:hypothetical protein [Longimicrobiales bacterium]
SQGGTMSLGRALRRPEGLMGVLNFSGFVPDHPDVPLEGARNAPPVFWGHGTSDPAIPFELAAAGRDRLREHGAELEFREYSMGHGILPQELADARAWIERILAAA